MSGLSLKTSRSVDQRRAGIIKWVNTHGYAQVEFLAAQFSTSEVTIRKDLAALADQKKAYSPVWRCRAIACFSCRNQCSEFTFIDKTEYR